MDECIGLSVCLSVCPFIRTIAESLRTGLTESPVQCESDAAAESLKYLSVFLPLALMGGEDEPTHSLSPWRSRISLSLSVCMCVSDGGYTEIVIEAGFADTIVATMKHGELRSDQRYVLSSGFTSSVNTAFASAIRHLTATEPKVRSETPSVSGCVRHCFQMMIDMGVAELTGDLLFRHHHDSCGTLVDECKDTLAVTVEYADTCTVPWLDMLVGCRYGESRVRASSPHNKMTQRILQPSTIKKLRALHRGQGNRSKGKKEPKQQ